MSSLQEKPHALCIPVPAPGHINPTLMFAKLLHSKGFLITFVNTEINHRRLIRSLGTDSFSNLPSFRFETIPDGLPPQNLDTPPHIPSVAKALVETGPASVKSLITKLNASYSRVTCIVTDFHMSFALDAATEFNIPGILYYNSGASSLLCYAHYPNLLEKGLIPPKGSSSLKNDCLDAIIDCIPTMHGMRLKHLPFIMRNLDPDDEYMLQLLYSQVERAKTASAIIFNTFYELDCDVFDTLNSTFPPCHAIGPLNLLENGLIDESLASIKLNLWKEDSECITWLDSKPPLSVIYVSFGSGAVITPQQLVEFAWGLAKSNCSFLWIIRPNLVIGDSAVLPPEFLVETKDRGLLASWCPQEEALKHPSIGGFLTHSGWNSTIESICSGVPMICWPYYAEQHTNTWWSCKWGIAIELENDAKSDDITKAVVKLMNGSKGNVMRKNAIEWKKKAGEAYSFPSGSSMVSLEKIIHILQNSST